MGWKEEGKEEGEGESCIKQREREHWLLNSRSFLSGVRESPLLRRPLWSSACLVGMEGEWLGRRTAGSGPHRVSPTWTPPARNTHYKMTTLFVCLLFVILLLVAVKHRLQNRATKTLLGLGRHLRQEVQRSEAKAVTLSMLQQTLRTFHIHVTPEVGVVWWWA